MVIASQPLSPSAKVPPSLRDRNFVTNKNSIPGATKLPANWGSELRPAQVYRKSLADRSSSLITMPPEAPAAVKRGERLATRNTTEPFDKQLLVYTTLAEKAHEQGNARVRNVRMAAGGVPVYTSSRSYGSSSYSHK